jgi:hypothetical protein
MRKPLNIVGCAKSFESFAACALNSTIVNIQSTIDNPYGHFLLLMTKDESRLGGTQMDFLRSRQD